MTVTQTFSRDTVNARSSDISLLLDLVFRKNPSSLNELTRYVESTVFREIRPEHSLIDKEQKPVGEFFYILNTFLAALAFQCNTLREFFDSET